METYSQTQAGASGSDPGSKCTVRAGETGLEEPLWQLGLVGGPESYPERPGEVDCRYYLRTGYCGYGNLCRFNHPRDPTTVMGAMRVSGGDYPERVGPPVCQYYMKTRMCKFGASCKYHHPSQGGGSPMAAALNIYGYPLRPGEKECSYYVKTGQCKFGVTCKFHHPQCAGVHSAAPVPGPAPVCPAASASTQPNVGASPVYGVTQLSLQAPAYTEQYVLVSSFPAPSGSSPMSDYFADLPQEVLLDILIRLPLKSIGRSRCVSKPWLMLLTSYDFIKAHLAHHTHSLAQQQQNLLLLSSSDSFFSLTMHVGGNHLRELEFFDKEVVGLVGSCNGLVLVTAKWTDKWLINCMTKEYVKLPESPFPLCPHFTFKKYGFGYDEVSDDYKIVKISQCDYAQFGKGIPNCPEIFVDIYSLKMRSWKRLETPLYGHDLLDHTSCVLINGALHWIGLRSSHEEATFIAAFDLSSEKFKEIPAPPVSGSKYKFFWAKPMVIDGCLGIVTDQCGALKTEIWLMKSYSVVESWTKIVIGESRAIKPLCFLQDKFLFQKYGHVQWYYLKDGRKEVCLAEDYTRRYDEVITYAESLVSPHFNYHS